MAYPTREELKQQRREQLQLAELEEELFGVSEERPRMTDEEFFSFVTHDCTDDMF